MKQKNLLFSLVLTFSSLGLFAQNSATPASVVHTDGIAILKTYNPSIPAFITDMNGKFVFSRFDAIGNTSTILWKYDPSITQWENHNKNHEELVNITGSTNISEVSPGSRIEAIYWKDELGTLWCLSSIDADISSPSELDKLWKIKNNDVLQTKDEQGNTVWQNKLSIDLRHQGIH